MHAIPRHSCLIVDDEVRLRQALVRVMQADGFLCTEAGSVREALEVLRHAEVDLLLSDMRMPGMDGTELLRRVRASHPDVAVIMITAVAEVEVAVECLALGAMDYITKPFVLEEVRARVAQALEKRRLIIENREHQERLEERVAEQARRLEELFLTSVQTLVEAIELKDPYTRGHSFRVSRHAVAVAHELDLAPEIVRQIDLGGHLHDIGKIGVQEAVLNKAGPLTAEEYDHIMSHPLLGWRILQPLLADAPVILNIVRNHHERFDGRGLPDRLTRDAIPVEARIISVVDAYDAMRSRRPYRHGRTRAEAVAELVRCSGSQFDSEIVTAFLGVLESGVHEEVEGLASAAVPPKSVA
jgi:putative two-component system response regulator